MNQAVRDALQAGLRNFEKMRNPDGGAPSRVGVTPAPGGRADPNGAFTSAEYVTPPNSGAGPEVGAGNEKIDLGTGLLAPPTSPTFAGAIFIHEGTRCSQTWTDTAAGGGGRSFEQWCQYWSNEYQVYRLQFKYFQAAAAKAMGEGDELAAADFVSHRNKRGNRAQKALAMMALLGC